ncbi:hypothetical protein V3C99_008698 [Haemonchus contortus]
MQLLFLLAALPTCSCPLEEPSNRVCKIVSDDIDLTEYDDRLSMLDQVEVLMGTLSLKGRNATGFPKLKNLVLLKEPKKRPVLVIEKNSKLSSLEALYNLEIQLRKGERPDNAINIGNNPKLPHRQERLHSAIRHQVPI